jgi:hypothetical protein
MLFGMSENICIIYNNDRGAHSSLTLIPYDLQPHRQRRGGDALGHSLLAEVAQVGITQLHHRYLVNLLRVNLSYYIMTRSAPKKNGLDESSRPKLESASRIVYLVEHFLRPEHFFRNHVVGGVLMAKVKVLLE